MRTARMKNNFPRLFRFASPDINLTLNLDLHSTGATVRPVCDCRDPGMRPMPYGEVSYTRVHTSFVRAVRGTSCIRKSLQPDRV